MWSAIPEVRRNQMTILKRTWKKPLDFEIKNSLMALKESLQRESNHKRLKGKRKSGEEVI